MPSRPFREGVRSELWDELIELRAGLGLSAARVEHFAGTFLNLPQIRSSWESNPAERGSVGYDFLVRWLEALPPPSDQFAQAAYNLLDEMPPPSRVSLTSRRKYIARQANLGYSTVHSREDRIIERFIESLTPAGSPSLQPSDGSGPLVTRIKQIGGEWQVIDLPVLDAPPTFDIPLVVHEEHLQFTYNARGELVQDSLRRTIEAIGDPLRTTGQFFNYPGVFLHRLSIEMLEGGKIYRLGKLGGYFSLDFELEQELHKGRSVPISFQTFIEGTGTFETFQRCAHEYSIDELTMTIHFAKERLPSRIWWFKNLPRDATPGMAVPFRLLPIAPEVSHPFGLQKGGPYYSGIGWEW